MIKKILFILIALLMLVPFAWGCSRKPVLNVLNWGDYIEESLNQKFCEKYNAEINYTTCDSNEKMYNIVATEGSTVDVIFPSDYLVERLIREDRLKKIDTGSLSNFKYILDFCKNRSFDPGNKYSVPYTWGTLGILYNKSMVKEPVTSWSILWDEKYKDEIYMYDSIRDAMAIALLKLGYPMNSKNEAEIQKAGEELIKQKPLVKAYGTDDIRESMIRGSGALGVVYSGDATLAISEDETGNLDYAIPEEGSNIWFDNMVILKNSRNPVLAMQYIDFLLDPENGLVNTDYIGYASPNSEVMENIGEDYLQLTSFNPPRDIIDRCDVFYDYTSDEKIKNLYDEVWNKVKTK